MWEWVDSLVPADISPLAAYAVDAQQHPYGNDQSHDAPAGPDTPQRVTFSPEVREHTLANIRDLQEIQEALSKGAFRHLQNHKKLKNGNASQGTPGGRSRMSPTPVRLARCGWAGWSLITTSARGNHNHYGGDNMNLKGRGKRFFVLAGVLAAGLLPGAGIAAQPPVKATKDPRILLTIPYEDREQMMAEMRTNLEQVRRLFVAYVESDFAAMEKIADEISIHKRRAQVVVRRGNQAYTDMAVNFHGGNSMEIREAAKSRDLNKVAVAVNTALQACVACHATWRLTEWPDNKTYPRPEPSELRLPPGAKILDGGPATNQ